jgi:hypothetical protein
MKRFVVTDPIFDVDYLVQIGGDLNDAIKAFAKRLGVEVWMVETSETTYGHFAAVDPYSCGCIWLKSQESALFTLIHEIEHAVGHAFRKKGIPPCEQTEEVYAYYKEWLAKEISKKWLRKKKGDR